MNERILGSWVRQQDDFETCRRLTLKDQGRHFDWSMSDAATIVEAPGNVEGRLVQGVETVTLCEAPEIQDLCGRAQGNRRYFAPRRGYAMAFVSSAVHLHVAVPSLLHASDKIW